MNEYFTISNLRITIQIALPAILAGITVLRVQRAEHQHRKVTYFIPYFVYAFVWMVLTSAIHNDLDVYKDVVEGQNNATRFDWIYVLGVYFLAPVLIGIKYAQYEMKHGRDSQDDGWVQRFQRNENQFVIIRTKSRAEFFGFLAQGSSYSPSSKTIYVSETWFLSNGEYRKRDLSGGFIFNCDEIQTVEFIKQTTGDDNGKR